MKAVSRHMIHLRTNVLKRFILNTAPAVRDVPKVDPNTFFGVHTDYGWFTIPRNTYATDWTIPQLHESIKEKYPDIDKKVPSHNEIQQVIDAWSQTCKPSSRPKPTKISRLDQQKLDSLLLYKQQTKALERSKAKKDRQKVKESKKTEKLAKKEQKIKEKAEYYQYILKYGKIPDTFDFSKIPYTSAWNHYAAKYYNDDTGADTKEKRANVSATWQALSMEEKEVVRQEYISLLKEGQAYERGKLVPLKTKIKRLRYQLPSVDK